MTFSNEKDNQTGFVELVGAGSVGTNRKIVATAGSAEQFTAQACRKVFIQALADNTDAIAIGDANVVAAAATHRGKVLYATQGDWFYVNNMNLLYIDSVVNGEGCSFYYED